MHVVDLSQLLDGESVEPTGRRSVRFDDEMTLHRPQEFFGIERSLIHRPHAQQQPGGKDRGKISRWFARLRPKSKASEEDLKPVPVHVIPDGEHTVRHRFDWGNYVAMSYTWGEKEDWEMTNLERTDAADEDKHERERRRRGQDDADENRTYTDGKVHEVILDGQRIRVRYNLWTALLTFREMAPFRNGVWLWVDALCINQQDNEAGKADKNRQLPRMPDIYRRAGNVVIHAGGLWSGDESTPWVLDYLQDISAYYRTEYYEALDHLEPDVAQSHRF